ncbi:MAG: Gfo/Idh/MocA family oxidoreductase [Clostridia bacterium]|nr:Gfo/Idh/MocA family oxidoreductase [Clostridia bacterium]
MKNIAILGCGVIASIMARTLREMKKRGAPITLYAAAARTLDRAQAFCGKEGFEKAYGSYEALVQDPAVDLVYIATPHSHHAEQAKLCIAHGKAILCEKAFTVNARQAREVLDLAREKNVLVAEAIWPRYMPSRKIICDLIESGAIGTPQLLTANLSGYAEDIERIWNPALAGGALLDVGIYPLTFMSMFFGDGFDRIDSSVQMLSTGVDRQETLTVHYPDGRMAVLFAGVSAPYPLVCRICGTQGYITVDYCPNPRSVKLYLAKENYAVAHDIALPEQISGYEYEIEACLKALEEGRIECPEMPHSETIRMMEIMDGIRAQWKMVYPFEA